MAGALINTMAEGMPKLLSTISMMKGAADADLAWLTQMETQVLTRMNPALSQGAQMPPDGGGPPGMGGPPMPGGMPGMEPGGMAGIPGDMGGGPPPPMPPGMEGIPMGPPPGAGMGPTDLGEISKLLNKRG